MIGFFSVSKHLKYDFEPITVQYLIMRFLLIVVISAFVLDETKACPPKEDLPNCNCTLQGISQDLIRLRCSNISSPESFKKQLQSLNTTKPVSIYLFKFNLPFFSDGTFNGSNIQSLTLASGSLGSFAQSSRPYAFSGLNNGKVYFSAFNLRMDNWDWNHFRGIKSLTYFTAYNCTFNSSTLPGIYSASLESVRIDVSGWRDFGNRVFLRNRNLTTISLKGNGLKSIHRDMFPRPANQLRRLMLRNNSLVALTQGLFENMPALFYLDISHNELMTLPELLFLPVVHQLRVLFVSGNPILCDHDMLWMKNSQDRSVQIPRRNDISRLTCDSPPKLKGKLLTNIFESDMDLENSLK